MQIFYSFMEFYVIHLKYQGVQTKTFLRSVLSSRNVELNLANRRLPNSFQLSFFLPLITRWRGFL